MKSKIQLLEINNQIIFIDSIEKDLLNKKVQRVLNKFNSYFSDFDDYILEDNLSHIQLEKVVKDLNKALTKISRPEVLVDPKITDLIRRKTYAINEQKVAGLTIKEDDKRWQNELLEFKKILDNEITRPLKPIQLRASFYLSIMKRAANFSVPGAGKTAMMYGTFAYLSSTSQNKIDKLLVISPINAFEAWRSEFIEVFQNKRNLEFMNLRDKKFNDLGKIRTEWGSANVVVLNYEALKKYKSVLNELINEKTMIVYDEVHRIKGTQSSRAGHALNLGLKSYYRYVLTGTPIPNSYQDIYNFLNILYKDEYDSYFGWSIADLLNPNIYEVNEKLQPFFWRTNKKDLEVPEADQDNILIVNPSNLQQSLAEAIYDNEPGILAIYIRLLQASTNPELLLKTINYSELGLLNDELNFDINKALNKSEEKRIRQEIYHTFDLKNMKSPKFEKGIELILQLVNEGKKVLVWGLFVGTMNKINKRLLENGINSILIYGETPKEDRVNMINNFRNDDVQVLISNPNTLGESISLHQTVHDAIYFEYNFNLTFMLQSRDRIHRLGLSDNQYTRYYYLLSDGDRAHKGFIDKAIYNRLKEKEEVMLNAIDGENLKPMIEDDYLEDVKSIIIS
ncbi:DEAD/DEAH box helicase [Mammaliicoccus sciuri]|nr:DEAD/DEAH box helicase [Mammaliicoccus sciuri]MEB6122661.1 DEAD/DEAH box helicase [Mammaliicoccus sciuri]MEB6312889.1 DEAD/DEAH box helicase [Mammaliicoccus sciuri]OFV60555.1 helicase [Mammaliicoccus sciuri]WQJ49770.1 DEAD/DEAH box helicase [Mammaliicoccus sciuri]